MPAPTLPLFRASAKMMLRSRGVIWAVAAGSVQILVFGLMKHLDFGFGGNRIGFFEFVLPGAAVYLAISQLQDIMVAIAANYKARGVLTRLAVTPVSPSLVIAVQITTYVVLGVIAAGIVLAIGELIGGNLAITFNLLWLVPLIALAVLTALATAFAVAGLMPNPQSASNTGVTISFLLFSFSGAMVPIGALPGPLPTIVPYVIPQAALIQAIRGIALTGAGITQYGIQVLVGVAWLAVAMTIAAIAYRFTTE